MGRLRQFYDGPGVPLRIDREQEVPVAAWTSHRTRLRSWLDLVPDAEWSGPTRCELWDITGLVRHLVSGSQFLGYTLHKARGGVPTDLMRGFDTHLTVQADAARFGEMVPQVEREKLAAKDASIAAEAEDIDWSAKAEAPPGQLPAHLAVNHFLLDSWVHEYDMMRPRGEIPTVDPVEAQAVVSYVIGLACLQAESSTALDLHMGHPDFRVGVEFAGETVHVTTGSAPKGAAVIEGDVVDFVDRTTGRKSGPVRGDESGLAVIDCFGGLLAR
jgi:uncharacterized protein (TIGR03083 family)